MIVKGALAASVLIFAAAPALAQPAAEQLQQVIDDHWAWRLEQSPTFATSVGVRDYDDRLGDNSLAAHEASVEKSREFLARLESIDPAGLDDSGRLNRELLSLELSNAIEAGAFGGKYLAITNRQGPHTFIVNLADRMPFFTKADYESYVKRLNAVPVYIDQTTERLRAGIETGWVQPCAPMEGYERTIRFHIVANPADSALMKPFAARPAAVSERDWRRLRTDAEKAVKDRVVPAFRNFADFYESEYKPACREDIGAASLPDGEAYYAHRVRTFTTTTMTADEIHRLGLSEVARIRREMEAIIASVKFEGGFKAFQDYLRTDPKFYAKTEDELVAATAMIAKKADGAMPKLFTRLPRMPYTVLPVPADIAEGTTTAYYERPSGDGSRAGVYRINTSLLDQRPLFELEALTLHEAVPGHHHQIALAQELTLPEFRRYGGFTAFTEGWGLYAESLGLDAGFYDDPYSNFGRLSYEMWRACRLVVDTGMHAKGWTRQQAIDFMAENTALSTHNIRAEIDRYIAWPGQALAYKIGELKMKELRARAAKALGQKFDLRRFHDALLENGGVPLSVLEAKIDAWIAAEKAR